MNVLDNSRLHTLAEFEDASFPNRERYIVGVSSVRRERMERRPASQSSASHGSDMKCGCFVGLAHVSRPFWMEGMFALNAGLFRLLRFEAAIRSVEIAFQRDF